MHKRSVVVMGFVAVAVAFALFYGLQNEEVLGEGDGVASISMASTAESKTIAVAENSPNQRTDAIVTLATGNGTSGADSPSDLPTLETPLKDYIDVLAERAERGDRRATCRLAHDLGKCRMLKEAEGRLRQLTNDAARAEPGSVEEQNAASELGGIRQFVESGRALCEGIDNRPVEAWRYLLAHAEQGSVSAIIQFASRPPLSEAGFGGDLEGWTAYRENVVRLLEKGTALGSRDSVYYLYRIYTGLPMPAGIERNYNDPFLAFVYAQAAVQIFPNRGGADVQDKVERFAQRLTVNERLAATRRASEIVDMIGYRPGTQVSPHAPKNADVQECFDLE